MRCYALILFLPATLAFQLPFRIPFFTNNDIVEDLRESDSNNSLPRVAIIGAGAGGTSAAFWIHKAKERYGLAVEIDVFERETYIGGRSTIVYPYSNTSLPHLELGASIFVPANKNILRASYEFNLTYKEFDQGGKTGVWNGEELLFSFGDGWWDTVKAIIRFGILAPKKTGELVDSAVKSFLTLYTIETPKWDDMSGLTTALNFKDMVEKTAADYFVERGVSKKYTEELIEAATRVNYGQNSDDIHGLGGAISMAATGAKGIQGGNFQIFEEFLKRSGANVHLDTAITEISEVLSPSPQWEVKSALGTRKYQAVILAAPFHSSGITIPSPLATSIPKQPYVHLHVTLLTTTSPTPDPTYFGLKPGSILPNMTLTSWEGVRRGGNEPEFNSLSYHGLVREGEWAVKIFSSARLSDEWLNKMFSGQVGWIHRKEVDLLQSPLALALLIFLFFKWDAYPKLTPTATFPPIKLGRGFYYVNAFEPFISTMETETIASRNIVDLLLHEEFGSGLCGPRVDLHNDQTPLPTSKEFVYGWDC
ncbi:hypothetical protein H0H81_011522 [Sphagnurus paluster]|uniref:Prenylcysteine lyase domain-containing protein n=1 Tax=Sphagnurus paluster TaxID=117069 RepID=A0A9P7KI94_9AGAR|nr:hypothetical protein H0H81_011522 [Sphagnurus paluster]